MDFLVILLLLIPFVILGIQGASKRKKQWQNTVFDLAERHGLTAKYGSKIADIGADGIVQGRRAKIGIEMRKSGDNKKAYTVIDVETAFDLDVELSSEGGAFSNFLSGPDVLTGDPYFDQRVEIRGADEAQLVSRLGSGARDALLRAFSLGTLELRSGSLLLSKGEVIETTGELEMTLLTLTEFANASDNEPASLTNRLRERVWNDPHGGYRLRCFHLWMSQLTNDEAVEERRACLAHPDPALRIAAARGLPPDEATDIIEEALRVSALDVVSRVDALDHLTRLERPPELALLEEHLLARSDEVRTAAARCLGLIRSLPAQERLLEVLEQDGVTMVQVAAARALGNVANIDAVTPLTEHSKGIFKSSELKKAAREAVAMIQARAGGGAGQLSLSEATNKGRLAVVEDADELELELELEG